MTQSLQMKQALPMKQSPQVVIIGAGPAGIRAAQTLVGHGLRPTVLDEAPAWGGQIYRQQPPGFTRPPSTLYGFEAKRATGVHAAMRDILGQLDYRPGRLVWNAEGGVVDAICDGQPERVPYTHLIVATGATDRVLPFPGWTTPGVFTLGAAQIALKYQACAIGERVVFAGTGPLLYLVAYQYMKAGVHVAAVLDTTPLRQQAMAAPRMLRLPTLLAKGLYYRTKLRLAGVPIRTGIRIASVDGTDRVERIHWKDGATQHSIACDAVGFGYALRPETQLADLLGCEFVFDPLNRAFVPTFDAARRSSQPGVYLAGDGAGIMGADAAELSGERAALAVIEDCGKSVSAARVATLEKALARIASFRAALEQAFPFPEDWADTCDDATLLCRCEEISVGAFRAEIQRNGLSEINRAKAFTRVGMGRCQGRMCGAAACEILAHAAGKDIAAVGRIRAQAPIKPIAFLHTEEAQS
mgnify:CR=1 FL=1